jgi:hypothetical protein
MVIHNLLTIHRDTQYCCSKRGLYSNSVISAGLNRFRIGPERQHRKIVGAVTRIETRGAISSNNLKMVPVEVDREWS